MRLGFGSFGALASLTFVGGFAFAGLTAWAAFGARGPETVLYDNPLYEVGIIGTVACGLATAAFTTLIFAAPDSRLVAGAIVAVVLAGATAAGFAFNSFARPDIQKLPDPVAAEAGTAPGGFAGEFTYVELLERGDSVVCEWLLPGADPDDELGRFWTDGSTGRASYWIIHGYARQQYDSLYVPEGVFVWWLDDRGRYYPREVLETHEPSDDLSGVQILTTNRAFEFSCVPWNDNGVTLALPAGMEFNPFGSAELPRVPVTPAPAP